MVSCAVHGCRNRSETGARMYGFPADLERRKKWLFRARRSDLIMKNSNYIKLCEAHFDPSQFSWSKKGKIRLVADAIPSIFTHCHFDKKRREPRLWPATPPVSAPGKPATSSVDKAHFEASQFSSAVQQVRLTDDAIPTILTHRPVDKKRKKTRLRPAQPPVSAPDIPAPSSADEAHPETSQFSWTKTGEVPLTADAIPTIFTHRPVDNKGKRKKLWPATPSVSAPDIPADEAHPETSQFSWIKTGEDQLTADAVPSIFTHRPVDKKGKRKKLWPATPPVSAPDIPATSPVDEDPEWNMQILESRLEEEEGDLQQSRDHEVELCQTLRLQVEDLQKRLEEKDNKLIRADKVIRALMDEVQKLRQQLEQHSRKYLDDTAGQEGRLGWMAKNDLIPLGCGIPPNIFLSCTSEDDPVRVEPCVHTGSVPSSDCRPSEPESGSSDAGTSHKDQDVTSQDVTSQDVVASHSPPVRPPLGTNIGLRTETRTVPSDCRPSEPEPGSSDAGTSHKDQDITSQDVTSQNPPPFSLLETNTDIKTEGGEIPIFPSCASEDDPADLLDVPDVPSPFDGSVTSPQELNLVVPSLRLLDCREMLGPDGIFKVQVVEDPSDEGDHGDALRHQDGDGDRDCKPENPSFAEPAGEQKKQSRDKRLKRKNTQGLKRKTTQGLQGKTTKSQSVKSAHKSRKRIDRDNTPSSVLQCRECGETFTFPRQLFIHQSMHAKERHTTATPHENTSIDSDSPNAGCLNTERYQVDHTYTRPYDENHDADTARAGESPQLTGLTSTEDNLHGNTSTDTPKTVSHQEVDGVCANATAEACTLSLLIQHLHSQSLLKLHQCDVCGKTLRSKQSLLSHKQRNTDEQPDACKRKREKVSHECDVCGKIFSKKSRLIDHKRLHTGEKPYACKHCDKTFRYHSNLKQHQWQHSEARPSFECDLCGKTFVLQKCLVIHKGRHADTSRFACKHCDKTFALRALLRSHMREHADIRPYVCTQCGAAFAQSGSLRCHMRTHTQEKPFKCTVCDKAFGTSAHLKVHTRMHTGERPYSCSQCPRSFPTTTQRKKHELSHSDEKPYLCLVCGLRCKTRQSLETHEWMHTGEKPFSCTLCNKAFRFKYLLAEHIRIHTGEKPYQCSDCGERFHTVTRLKIHQVCHREKMHSCHVCGKAYRSVYYLKTHQRIHTGERPYQCSICGEKFRYQVPLQTHQRKVHNIDSPKCQQKSRKRVCTRAKRTNAPSVGRNHRTHSNTKHQKELHNIETCVNYVGGVLNPLGL